MQQLDDIEPGPVHNVSDLIQFISNCDQIIHHHPKPLYHSYQHFDGDDEEFRCDFLLIGSRALNDHWKKANNLSSSSEEEEPSRWSWTQKVMKKWSDERFNRKSADWDLICLNRDALVNLLKSKEFKEISLNYAHHVHLKKKNISNRYESSDFYDWVLGGGQARRWIEFSIRLEQFDGEIIEIEYCTDRYHLLKYLEMREVSRLDILPSSLIDSFSCEIAPLQLLEIIKKSHLQFNIDDDNWTKHILDIELIHLILPTSEQYHEKSLRNSIYDLAGLVHYDRLTKRIVKYLHDEGDSDFASNFNMFMFSSTKDDIYDVVSPLNEEMLYSAFGVSSISMKPYHIQNNLNSLRFISQQVAANLLSSVVHAIDSNELEKLVFKSMKNAIEQNIDTFLFGIMRDNFMKLSEMVFDMLNQPLIFKKLFETKAEMNQFRFKNAPIDFENVKEISNKEGATLSHHYLPIEIVMTIASYIPKAIDLTNLMRLDKSWNNVFESNDVWKYLCYCRYPKPAHYSLENDSFQVDDWKYYVLSRSMFERVQFPTIKGLDCLLNAFRVKFIDKSTIFKQFVNDFFTNTYIATKTLNDDKMNEYNTMKATLITYWPCQSPLKYDIEIVLDLAEYRSGDSKGGSRSTVSGKLHNSEHFSNPLRLVKFNKAQNFIGKYYLQNMNPDQYASLFTTLLVLGLGDNEFIRTVFGYGWSK
ncbi:predicted protein [Naegleria gruberi]|uniref:Predicted protein n=1 Tax=Naegleria gruberi TaxID=5762 RepID=D2W2V2_NAEGR|nr:uncharacterized protein NAEGRDRAFT_75723 [Naegleria gruberi]EFC36579.1 predicted protein [Naegleria gruberi]|eukprot:XP_002669323.1 predicted protein [Naegleria gruberi strain NEG-M]